MKQIIILDFTTQEVKIRDVTQEEIQKEEFKDVHSECEWMIVDKLKLVIK